VYFSLDDGAHWQSLRLNMPITSQRDLTIHGDDLITATHGRGFWILDDITPLRQKVLEQKGTVLFEPQTAVRVRRNQNPDTPVPPEEPAGRNPPDGAILYYKLDHDAPLVTLEILDATGKVFRRYRSDDKAPPVDPELNVPLYWLRPHRALPSTKGMHRFVWDLYGEPVRAMRYDYPISAIYHDTPREPRGVLAAPGRYTVRLTVEGELAMTKTFTLKMDPRVTTPASGLAEQYRWSVKLADLMNASFDAAARIRAIRATLAKDSDLDQKLAPLSALAQMNGTLSGLLNVIGSSDAAPTTQAVKAATEAETQTNALLAKWRQIQAALP
jgi:hypothetical protein